MLVYILFIILIFVLRFQVRGIPNKDARDAFEKKCLFWVACVLLLLTAIRGANVGTDTRNYLIMYVHKIQYCSYSDVYFALAGSSLTHYIFKTFSLLHLPPQFLLGVIELIYISAIVRFINLFSKDKLLSFFCFFILVGLYDLSVPALKQCSAMGFALHAYVDLYNKKTVRAMICFVVAFFFHKTSLIFMFGLLLYFIRNKDYYYAVIGAVALACLLMGRLVLVFALDILNDEHYTEYLDEGGRYTWVTFIYFCILLFIVLMSKKQYTRYNCEESRIMYGYVIIAIALQSLSSIIPSAFRLASYYLPFFIILLPNSLSLSSNRKLYRFTTIVIMLFFFFYTSRNGGNIVPYKFFWQDYDIPNLNFGG